MDAARAPRQDPLFTTLRRFAPQRRASELCELCSTPVAAEHPHLITLATGTLVCCCDACAILFSHRGDGKYKRVPRRVRLLDDFVLTDGQWDTLAIPIGLAFFFHLSAHKKLAAFYPSPAGATESLLSLDTWADIARANPVLHEMEPDVEALLVNRVAHMRGGGGAAHYLVPIDECYRLVGLIRANWRGFSGGTEVWGRIDQFFAELRARATPASAPALPAAPATSAQPSELHASEESARTPASSAAAAPAASVAAAVAPPDTAPDTNTGASRA